ncbi:MAG: MarC family protein [Candidatus Altiarchaeales archaeon]|nr:MarC family protein [Candidatus Altiarchaeales archaeon]
MIFETELHLTLYFLAIINPLSKVFILSTYLKDMGEDELHILSIRSSVVALTILFFMVFAGNFILENIFHVELYSLRMAGGIVFLYMGFKALTHGIFYEIQSTKLDELSIVPFASPLIAGPAVIVASISFAAEYGSITTLTSLTIAVAVNLMMMLSSRYIGGFLLKHNIMGAIIRLTGLIVLAIAVQMILTGAGDWLQTTISALEITEYS